jgi:hypothetical protein
LFAFILIHKPANLIFITMALEHEVEEVLEKPGEDRPGREGSRICIGQTRNGRYLRVIYVPDPVPQSVFVITAYELTGKTLKAFKRRRRRKLK